MKHVLIKSILLSGLVLWFTACEDYLDKSPETDVNPEEVFTDFKNFQGFTENLYAQVVDVTRIIYASDFNFGEDVGMNATYYVTYQIDGGNYWNWNTSYASIFGSNYRPNQSEYPENSWSPTTPYYKGFWYNSWYGIRVANIGLDNLHLLVNATQEEKDVIKGQLLFFRAYYYFTLMRDWGGLPYIDKALSPNEEMKYPRLKYQETALRAAVDLEEAIELLPLNWDKMDYGRRTLGNNKKRINKIMALAFLGKNYLYAASPLMNKESTGAAGYNAELCQKAAEAFAKVINYCEDKSSGAIYSLQPWDKYSDIFYTVTADVTMPGGSEVIFSCPPYTAWMPRWTSMWGTSSLGHEAQNVGATANYVKNWGMANGLPIDDPNSGYDPTDPWSGRDPRFYKTIITDGDQLCNATSAGIHQYAQLYRGGAHRNSSHNVTGFMIKKYFGLTCNLFDGEWEGDRYQFYCPVLRLADVYLMYAEAVLHGYGSPQSNVTGCHTAEEALNKVRGRAGVPAISAKYTANKEIFMEELIRERAVELSFENLRWNDLRRWLKSGDPKYLDKTELLFDRDPATGKPINFQERLLTRRVVTEKHNWLPLPMDQVSLYPSFGQNPGW